MRALGLSVHASYACGRSGACCTSGWTIPVETPVYERLECARTAGAWGRADQAPRVIVFPACSGEYTGLVPTDVDGRCGFFEPGDAGPGAGAHAPSACGIQRRLGHAALPHACQQFPRVVVLRPGSIARSLSHYCPTAVGSLLAYDGRLTIDAVAGGGGQTPGESLCEGLDARDALPPRLRPDALFSWDAFDAWERFVVGTLGDPATSLGRALERLAATAEMLRSWTVERGPFDAWASAALGAGVDSLPPGTGPLAPVEEAPLAHRVAVDACGAARRAERDRPDLAGFWRGPRAASWTAFDAIVRRYLATRAWASWVAHESGGVRSYVRWVLLVLGVLRTTAARTCADRGRDLDRDALREAIRRADLLLVHHLSPARLARVLARAEGSPLWEGLAPVRRIATATMTREVS